MKIILFTILFTGLAAGAQAETRLDSSAALSPAKLQPSSGLDLARSPGERGSVRTFVDSVESWKQRFPKQPNGRPR